MDPMSLSQEISPNNGSKQIKKEEKEVRFNEVGRRRIRGIITRPRRGRDLKKVKTMTNFTCPNVSIATAIVASKKIKLSQLSFALFICLATLISLTTIFPTQSKNARWILEAEAIKLQPEGKDKFYWSGEQFVITCQNNNNIKNVKIRWIGPNGLDITEDRSQRVHAESTGPHGHRLVVMNATASVDDGQYKCTLGSTDDRNPREHIEFNLKLFKTTSFKDTTRHLVLPTGQQGVLNCRVEFDSNVTGASVGWIRNQKPIEMFNDSSYSVLEYDSNRQLSQLIISPLTKEHDGIYTCRAVAVTAQLSKISDHDINLETNYAPTFDQATHTIWVERSQSILNRQQQQHASNVYANNRPPGTGGAGYQHQSGRLRHNNKAHHVAGSMRGPTDEERHVELNATGMPQLVRVELRCTCQSNPPASILWTSTENNRFVLSKGDPAHVLEEPRIEVDGHNTTSILVINYNLDPEWPSRRTSYICSASNQLGKATKTYSVEQGDPPPAFNVGPTKNYNPQTSVFKFTLMAPNFDPESSTRAEALNSVQQKTQEIIPMVDSFRIRAESATAGEAKQNYWSKLRRQSDPSVQWSLTSNNNLQSSPETFIMPQNFSINLSKLPSGNQKLYLEAHNAVGWSPNSTYLGDYYIVSGAYSLRVTHLLISACLAFVFLASNKNEYLMKAN